jgi:hypothetical protein
MLYLETGSGLTLADTIRASGTKIDVGNNSNPEVNDWNEDGKKDLLIGTESGSGTIRVYLNQGTDANPVFTTYSYVYCGGSPIYHYRATPRVYDLDGDGKKDIVTGDQYTYIYFYKNTGTNASPVFSSRDTLRLTTSAYISGYQASRIYCTDYNGDGAVDLWTSDYYGYITYYQNTVIPGVEETEQQAITSMSVTPTISNGTVSINYSLALKSEVNIEAYTADGRLVEIVAIRNDNAGNHQVRWHKQDLQPGVYFFKLTVNNETETRKIIIL